MYEKVEIWGFKYIIQVAWINQVFFSGQHFEANSEGNTVITILDPTEQVIELYLRVSDSNMSKTKRLQ